MPKILNLPIYEICEKYLNGMNTVELAKEYSCTDGTIGRKLRDNGIRMRTTGESKTLNLPIDRICREYIDGVSLSKLAGIYKCSIPTIIKRLTKNGVKTRSISESKLGVVSTENNPNYINLPIDKICEKYLNGMSIVGIAKEYNCSVTPIVERLRNSDIKIRLSSKRTLEHSQHLSASLQGISYDEWESFAQEQKYCPLFNERCRESNREKYDRRCFLSGLSEEENLDKNCNIRKLSVHHVDMDKMQGCDGKRWKLVPLSMEYHRKTHGKDCKLWETRIIWLLNNIW